MADLNNEEDWSTDEDDEEYVPPDGEISDEEISDQSDEEPEVDEDPSLANPGHKRKAKSKKKGKRRRLLTHPKDNSEDEKSKEEPKLTEEDEKKKMDSLWADFLGDPVTKTLTPPTKNNTSSNVEKKNLKESLKDKNEKASTEKNTNSEEKVELEKPKKVTVTELFQFAGETVEVKKEVDASSLQAKNGTGISGMSTKLSSDLQVGRKPTSSGIGNLLQQIGNKKGKLSVLEKTKLDWNTFKKDEGIEEDLKIHNKGKDGYLDKMEFLERTDLRQFEIEKRIRSINRSHKS